MDFWVKWLIVALYAINSLIIVGAIGKARRPITPGQAASNLVVAGTVAVLIAVFWDTSR
ncbi:hypothetical protein ACIBTV_26690 [Micromonospora sp. NPDC049366]|uniref:hypothetical protein n=1 Tax=Micromonospora sp. NPDC049366 TaxID=3364271 RepID=UPI0037B26C2E